MELEVYGDFLQNGFQNRVWPSLNLANTRPVHAGIFSISVTPTGYWQGVYLHHENLDTTPYASLSFWVNGGTNGGQRIQIQGLLGETNPPPDIYQRVTLETDTWQEVTVPLASLGVEDKTNFTGFWIQLTPNGTSNAFYVDDVHFDEKPAPPVARLEPGIRPPGTPGHEAEAGWDVVAWCIAGALVVMTGLLAWLILMLRRSGLGTSTALVPLPNAALPQSSLPPGSFPDPTGDVRRALESATDPQGQALRDRIAAELAEFVKQSLVQGLYSQRGRLIETQQKAQAALADLEARLVSLHVPLQERLHAYETRIGELEKALETRDEEMRNLIHATLLLVRERLEEEKARDQDAPRFN